MRGKPGYTLAEVLIVMAVVAAVGLIALPRLGQVRDRAAVAGARETFVATHALARQVASQYGRLGRFHLDPGGGAFWVTVDTSVRPGEPALDTVLPVVWMDRQFSGVRVEGRQCLLCFDPRGVATARENCDLPNLTVVFRRGRVADTLTISRLGRVLRR